MYKSPLPRAVADLFWTFFPVFIVVFILALVGRLENLLHRTDLILSASVLFAEGWSRSRSAHHENRAFLQFIGFIGSLFTVILSSIMLLVEVGGITQLASVVESSRFSIFHYLLLILSVLYGLIVRVVVYSREPLTPYGSGAL